MSIIIIGLGNPDKQYEKTRHNAGFMAVDLLLGRLRSKTADYRSGDQAPDFEIDKKTNSLLVKPEMNEKKVIIAKPQTFMNNSGEAVSALVNYYKIGRKNNKSLFAGVLKSGLGTQADKLVIIYDELDLPFSTLRVKFGGSSAGHNGIKSIMEKMGTDKFWRVRLGISNDKCQLMPADKFVLSKFSKEEIKDLKEKILPKVAEELNKIITHR